jgi:hypothetical protein
MRIKHLFAGSFLLFFIICTRPPVAEAQTDCHGSTATSVELFPEITVTGSGHPTDDHVPLEYFLSGAEREVVMRALDALGRHHDVGCGHAMRARFLYDQDLSEFRVSVLVRENEACWEAVSREVLVHHAGRETRLGSGYRPRAAILDADAHGTLADSEIAGTCGETASVPTTPEPSGAGPPPERPTETLPPRETHAEETACGGGARTVFIYENTATERAMNGINEGLRSELMSTIVERLGIRCDHELHIRIARHERGADVVVHMWSSLVGHDMAADPTLHGEGEGRVWLDEGSRLEPAMTGGDGNVVTILREIGRNGFLG